jgi:pyruvate,water dikinase
LLAAIANHVTAESCPTPEEIDARERIEAAKAWNDFSRAMRWWQRPLLSRLTRYLLRKGKRAYVLRELSRSELVRVTAEIRRWLLVLAQRFVSRGWIDGPADFFFLLPEEIAAARGAELRRYITRRKSEHDSWRALHMPMLIRGVPETDHIREEQLPASAPAELHGQCISAGVTEGDVVVVRTPMEYERMKPGSILVAPATDSAWMPLFTQAVGIIVETGGVLSHAAVVAREFGLPALANVKDATGVLRDGMTVRLDATNVVATILRASEPDG